MFLYNWDKMMAARERETGEFQVRLVLAFLISSDLTLICYLV